MAFALTDLDHHTGSEKIYGHPLVRRVRYTEGVQHLASGAGAYWLLDFIATNQLAAPVKGIAFQVWELKVSGSKATLVCKDDDTVILTHEIAVTDFPEPGVTVWFTDDTVLLPSEY